MDTLTMVYIVAGSVAGLILLILLKVCYINGGVCQIQRNMTGKVVFITGGNTGLGEFVVQKLANMGACVVIGCRDTAKAEAVIDRIKDANTDNLVYVLKLDLSDLNSVDDCVDQFKTLNIGKIDILINNAGIMAPAIYKESKQGYEIQFGTNYLGHFYLTELLVPFLKNSENSRVINLSSIAHIFSKLDLEDLNCQRYKNSCLWADKYTWNAYGNSKLCAILHAMELFNRHGIKACALHPGVVRSGLFAMFISNPIKKIIFYLIYPFWFYFTKSVEQGSQTHLHCALIGYDELIDGAYYKDCKVASPSYVSEQLAEQMYDITTELINRR